MRRIRLSNTPLLVILIVSVFLSGCSGSTATPSVTTNPSSTISYQSQDYCTLVSTDATATDPTQEALNALVPEASPTDWIKGSDLAEVTIIEYADFQCPGCAAMLPIFDQLMLDFPSSLRLVYRHFPNPIHDKALLTVQAAEAAGLQGKFWPMHDYLYSHQADWAVLSTEDFNLWLHQVVISLGLDSNQFEVDYNSQAIIDKAINARDQAIQLGIPYTPFLVINGTMWQGPREYQSLHDVIALLLLENRQVTGCPPFTIDPSRQYLATITTDKGTIVLQLFADKAPLAVNTFVYLARRGFYNSNPFHRVISGYLAQTGDPSGTGYGGPGFSFPLEIDPALSFDHPGMVGLANAGPDTNGSQFFITLKPMPELDGQYTLFGQVIQGLDVVQSLTVRDPSNGLPLPIPDKIIQVDITER